MAAEHSGVPLFVPAAAEARFVELYATRRRARAPSAAPSPWWQPRPPTPSSTPPPQNGALSSLSLSLLLLITASLALLRTYHHLVAHDFVPSVPLVTAAYDHTEELIMSYSDLWDRLLWLRYLGLEGHPLIKQVRIEILFYSQFVFVLLFLIIRYLAHRSASRSPSASPHSILTLQVDLNPNCPLPDPTRLQQGVRNLLDGYKIPTSPTQLFLALLNHANDSFLSAVMRPNSHKVPVNFSTLQAIQLLIISTAISDYYGHDLPTLYRHLKKELDIIKAHSKKTEEDPASDEPAEKSARRHDEDRELFVCRSHAENILYIVNRIGERLNIYEGAGLPERFQEFGSTVGSYVAHLHRSIFALLPLEVQRNFDAIFSDYLSDIFSPEAEISREIALLLVRKPRLLGPGLTLYDDHYRVRPSHTQTIKRFDAELRDKSQCLFAAKSRLWSGHDVPLEFWSKSGAIEKYARMTLSLLTRFIVTARFEHLDGFIWAIPDVPIDGDPSKGTWGESPENVGQAMYRLLSELARLDPSNDNCLSDPNEVSARSWQYRHTNQRCFMTSFAPCYPEYSPRYCFGSEYVWILLQPEYSFSHHNIDHPLTGVDMGVRKKVHKNFVQAGRPYRESKAPTPNAALYVRPLDEIDGEMVVWWKRPADTA